MMKKLKMFLLLLAAASLVGCAGMQSGDTEMTARLAAVRAQGDAPQQLVMVWVEETNNLISTKLMQASVKAGMSTRQSENMVGLMRKSIPFVVSGDDDGLSYATLERALLDAGAVAQGRQVTFVAAASYESDVKALASKTGANIRFVRYPA